MTSSYGILTILSMILGNLITMAQTSMKLLSGHYMASNSESKSQVSVTYRSNVWTTNGKIMDDIDSRLATFEMKPLFKHDSSHLPSSETPEHPLFPTLWANYLRARDFQCTVSMESSNKTYGTELYSLPFVSRFSVTF
ncbi:hypothetical protein M9H77_07656 [Catharanthus roseus]|uniref:Uncharacterized protein n=1 Tax=Catharanthus roseus TaxID=4058 RepID=A0ACC0BVU5_CATRO|nr:hypothetical protein M9H77_07656 [Catharanthus roseus]